MSYSLVDLPAMMIVGKQIRTNNKECIEPMTALWTEMFKENHFSAIPNVINPATALGVYTDYTPDFKVETDDYSYTTGMQVAQEGVLPEEMVLKHIPGGQYAVFTCAPDQIGATWQQIWQTPLKRTFVADFEVYELPEIKEVQIYIGIDPS